MHVHTYICVHIAVKCRSYRWIHVCRVCWMFYFTTGCPGGSVRPSKVRFTAWWEIIVFGFYTRYIYFKRKQCAKRSADTCVSPSF